VPSIESGATAALATLPLRKSKKPPFAGRAQVKIGYAPVERL